MRPYNPGPWYHQRNARIYEQARAGKTLAELAAYWKLEQSTIESILTNETTRRGVPKKCRACGKEIEYDRR